MNRTQLVTTGKPFVFTPKHLVEIDHIKSKYPPEKSASAVMPVLWLAQQHHDNWISKEVVEAVAITLNLPVMRVYEVVTFYTMYNIKPVGRHHIQVCRTTPCWLRGSDDVLKACFKACDVSQAGEVSPDQQFSIVEVECLGACANAPMVQINNDYYEDLTPQLMTDLIDKLRSGQQTTTGSQTGRKCSQADSRIPEVSHAK